MPGSETAQGMLEWEQGDSEKQKLLMTTMAVSCVAMFHNELFC
jgi:hypothetical protein